MGYDMTVRGRGDRRTCKRGEEGKKGEVQVIRGRGRFRVTYSKARNNVVIGHLLTQLLKLPS